MKGRREKRGGGKGGEEGERGEGRGGYVEELDSSEAFFKVIGTPSLAHKYDLIYNKWIP